VARKPASKSIHRSPLAARIRTECIRRGWALVELARRAGVARQTLYHLERSHTSRPHNETLQRIAKAFDIPVEVLLGEPVPAVPPGRTASGDEQRQKFDAGTNPAVAEVLRDQPHLVEGWSADDFDELNSAFGTGGALTPRGVEMAAESINRRRETVQKLQVVLETHLRKDAMDMIDMFYRMVQPPQMRAPEPAADDNSK
jgi:transcriptional regulator with XRE-family HTH domain